MISYKNSDAGRVQAGFSSEKHDCTVRAAAIRFTTSYARAHELLESVGRRVGHGVNLYAISSLLEKMGLEIRKPLFRITLNQFIKQNPKGRFYVVVRGHAVGIIDGVCIDTVTPKGRARVLIYA
jgi:hypothetical protein